MTETDVAIIGLGPTGLPLAHMLGQRGHRVTVLERNREFYGQARAAYADDECMRLLQGAAIADDLAPEMIVDCPAQWMKPDGSILAQYNMLDRPNGWRVTNFLYQPWLENTMETLLMRYPNVTLRRGCEVTVFDQDETGVAVHHRSSESGEVESLRARYLVGADGGRSTTRRTLGIEMVGTSYPERWLVIDLKVENAGETLRHLPYFSFICDPHQPVVCCPQPGGHHRFEFMLRRDQDAAEMEQPETICSLFSRFIDPDKAEILRALGRRHGQIGRPSEGH